MLMMAPSYDGRSFSYVLYMQLSSRQKRSFSYYIIIIIIRLSCLFSPSRELHGNSSDFQHFSPDCSVNWVNWSQVRVFYIVMDCISPPFPWYPTSSPSLNYHICHMTDASFVSLHMSIPPQSVVSNCRFDISDA